LAVIFILVGGGGGKGIILAAEAEQVVEFIYESSRQSEIYNDNLPECNMQCKSI
jgi:hypothetical protein